MEKNHKKCDESRMKPQNTEYLGFFKFFNFILFRTKLKQTTENEFGIKRQLGRYPVAQHFDVLMSAVMLRVLGFTSAEHSYDLKGKTPAIMPFRFCLADTILNRFRLLQSPTLLEPYVVKDNKGVETQKYHRINLNDRLNRFLLKVLKALDIDDYYQLQDKDAVVDIDATEQISRCKEGDFTFKKSQGFMPTVSLLNKVVVYIQNVGGNTPPSYRLLRVVQNTFENLRAFGYKVNKFRSDAAAYQMEIIDWCVANDIYFFIRSNKGAFKKYLQTITEPSDRKMGANEVRWRPVVIRKKRNKVIQAEVASIYITTTEQSGLIRYVIQRTKKTTKTTKDKTAVQKQGYVYRAIATNYKGWSDQRVINFYNQRGDDAENSIKDLKHRWNWNTTGSHDFKSMTVNLFINAIARTCYQAFIQYLWAEKTSGIYPGMTISKFRKRYIEVSGSLVKDVCIYDKNDPFKQAA